MWTWGDRSFWTSMKEVYLYWWRWYCAAIIFIVIGHNYGLPLYETVFWVCVFTLMHQAPPITIHNIYTYILLFFIVSLFSYILLQKTFLASTLIFILCFVTMDR